MKKQLFLFCIILFSIDTYSQSNDEIALFQSIWGMEKREIVKEYMNLSSSDELAFWEEYNTYEEARKELGRERIEIINQYINGLTSINNEMATDLMNQSLANQMAIQKLVKKTFKKLSSETSPVTAAKFIQLENYFYTSMQLFIQESIPFIGELDKLKGD